MANSIIEICNNALQDLGEDSIVSLTDDSKAARLCARRWNSVRDTVLRAHPWNCALKQAELAASETKPLWKWAQAYPLPADFLRIEEVVASDKSSPVQDWETQGGSILCNEDAPLYITYVRRESDPRKYDPLLDEALAARLSAVLAYPLTGSTSLANALWEAYREKLAEARSTDARESTPTFSSPTSWLNAKLG